MSSFGFHSELLLHLLCFLFSAGIVHTALNDTNGFPLIRKGKAAFGEKAFVANCISEKADVFLWHMQ